MTPDREEKCRVICQWLGWTWNPVCPFAEEGAAEWDAVHIAGCWSYMRDGKSAHTSQTFWNFYESEDSSALLVEKARFAVIPNDVDWLVLNTVANMWMGKSATGATRADRKTATNHDRKTAIAEAGYLVAKAELEKRA